MKNDLKYLLILPLVVIPLLSPAQQTASPSLPELEVFVEKWIELRGRVAEEKRDWESRRNRWKEEIDLLAEESILLQKELDEYQNTLSNSEHMKKEALRRMEASQTILAETERILDRSRVELGPILQRIPESRATEFSDAGWTSGEEGLTLPKKAQRLVAFLRDIETLQNEMHVVTETLEIQGTKRQVDVLYIGLATAYAVSPGNDWAAVGTPGVDGWAWDTEHLKAHDVRKAIELHQKERTAEWVHLPLKLPDGGGQ